MKPKNFLIDGEIPPEKLTQSVINHQSKTGIGGHAIFLGQVRADLINGNKVQAIEFSVYEEMANQIYEQIREEVFEKFDITCAHVYHSRGMVMVGQLCFYVFTSSKRRKAAINACDYFVEEIKKRVPIFGKELLSDSRMQWKVNTN